jgi:hypothetical protein
MMPENNVPCLTMAFDIGQLVELLDALVVLIGVIVSVLRLVSIIESPVAFRPDDKSAAIGWHIIDVTDYPEMERVRISMASVGFKRNISFRKCAINTPYPVWDLNFLHP